MSNYSQWALAAIQVRIDSPPLSCLPIVLSWTFHLRAWTRHTTERLLSYLPNYLYSTRTDCGLLYSSLCTGVARGTAGRSDGV